MRASSIFALVFAVRLAGAHQTEVTELKDGAGNPIIQYVIEVPEGIASAGVTDPAKQVGLFLCFPEHDHGTGDELLPVREALRRQGLSGQYILLAGHPQAQKFSIADHEPIQKLIEWAVRNYPINPRRIYMYGKGEGGKVSAEFTATHPDIVTAAISYSWGWWIMPSELDRPLDLDKAPEFYMVLGLRDLATHITTVRDAYSRVHAKGYHVIYREIDDLGARTYHPPTNDDAVAWATRLRNKNLPLSAGEAKLLKQFHGNFGDLALVGGVSAGEIAQRQMQSKDTLTRAAAAESCAHAIFDEATVAALAGMAVDRESAVREAAFRALAVNAGWRSAAAQKILIDLATKPGKSADRASAIDGLGQAVHFQVKGVRQDPPVFAALVALLKDPDEELKGMSANILAPIRDPGFRGDSGRPEQKAPPGGWQQWLAEVTTLNAGYAKDYEVCTSTGTESPMDLFCKGGSLLHKQPMLAFQNTLRAAEQGYVPAQAAVGMMYADGQGVQQDYVEAGKWWTLAGTAGHPLASANAARVPKQNPWPAPK